MRVLYLNPSGGLGGAERCLLDVLASLRHAEPDWKLYLIASEDGPLLREAAKFGIETRVLAMPARVAALGDSGGSRFSLAAALLGAAGELWGYRRRLRQAIAGLQPDLVHTNGFKMHVLGALSTSRAVPVLWHVHDYAGSRPVMSRALGALLTRCRLMIANSESVATDLRAAFPKRPLDVRVVLNAVDLARFTPDGNRLDLDRLAGLQPAAPGTIRIGLVATFARWKGHEVFLRALSRLGNLPVRGYVVGGPIYRTSGSQFSLDQLRAMAASLGVEAGFTGFVENTGDVLRSLDIVVHASTEPEPFGLVITEAMACGRAVVAAQGGGAGEIYRDGIDALAVPRGDDERLAQQIIRLVRDRELRVSLGLAARKTMELRFGRPRLASQLAPIYREVVAAG